MQQLIERFLLHRRSIADGWSVYNYKSALLVYYMRDKRLVANDKHIGCIGVLLILPFYIISYRLYRPIGLNTLCLKKSMRRYLFEHNSNINCPIITIFGTVVTETISY